MGSLKSKAEDWKERVLARKWASLEARGFTRPKDKLENDQRAKEAHDH